MEENNKYYTPKITDLKVGYICESTTMPSSWSIEDCNGVDNSDDIWGPEPITWGRLCDIIEYSEETEGGIQRFIRTPYLSKEDIESEGWIFIPDRNYEENSAFKFHKDNYEVILWTHFNRLLVKNFRYGVVLFESGVKKDMSKHQISINEFRYITRELLGIE